jgi:hypothetical protein
VLADARFPGDDTERRARGRHGLGASASGDASRRVALASAEGSGSHGSRHCAGCARRRRRATRYAVAAEVLCKALYPLHRRRRREREKAEPEKVAGWLVSSPAPTKTCTRENINYVTNRTAPLGGCGGCARGRPRFQPQGLDSSAPACIRLSAVRGLTDDTRARLSLASARCPGD